MRQRHEEHRVRRQVHREHAVRVRVEDGLDGRAAEAVAEAAAAAARRTDAADVGFLATVRELLGDDVSRVTGATYAFLIFRRDDEVLLGGITLSNVRRGVAQSASAGYWMGKRYARKGYMAEAIRLTLDFSFDTLGLHRVEAACLPSNTPSLNLLLKSGFIREGVARRYLRINGTWQDHVNWIHDIEICVPNYWP